jgi:uncharacterized membrane protein
MLKVMVAFLDWPAASDVSAISMTVDLLFNLAVVVLPYAVCITAVLLTMQVGEMPRRVEQVSRGRPGGAAPQGNSLLITAGLFLGIGVGGLITDILLRQILQWHHMLSSRIPPETLAATNFNMVWDGVASLMSLATILTGVALLVRAARRGATMSSGVLIGAMLAGWGLFTIVEGMIAHLLFAAHHTHSGHNHLAWDLGSLIFGAALMLIGSAIARRSRAASGSYAAPTPS